MARAATIWVLTNQGGAEPSHAFTVKHELISHMRRFADGLKGRNVFRLGDGGGAAHPVYSWPASEFLVANG